METGLSVYRSRGPGTLHLLARSLSTFSSVQQNLKIRNLNQSNVGTSTAASVGRPACEPCPCCERIPRYGEFMPPLLGTYRKANIADARLIGVGFRKCKTFALCFAIHCVDTSHYYRHSYASTNSSTPD